MVRDRQCTSYPCRAAGHRVDAEGRQPDRKAPEIMKENILPDPSARMSNSNRQAAGGEANRRLVGYRNILVPVDFSEHSKKTIDYARQLAASTGAGIKIMHVLRMAKNPERFYEGLYIVDEVTKTRVEKVKREGIVKDPQEHYFSTPQHDAIQGLEELVKLP